MKRIALIIVLMAALMATASDGALWDAFVNPPDDCRTKVWWFHGETETTREGIDADLREFKDKGIGGVVFYDQVHGRGEGAPDAMSPQWWEMLKYAARRAKELGLSFEVAVGNGYVAGGPWITKELAMKKTAALDTIVTIGTDGPTVIDLSGVSPDFRDIATLMWRDRPNRAPIRLLSEKITVTAADTSLVFDIGHNNQIHGITYSLYGRGKGSTGSMNIPGDPAKRYFGAGYVDYGDIGCLEGSIDSVQWTPIIRLPSMESNIGHRTRRRTLCFGGCSPRFVRLHLDSWKLDSVRDKSIAIDEITLLRTDMINNHEVKSGLRTEVTYPAQHHAGEWGKVKASDIIDVSHLLDSAGRLTVAPGAGTWHLLRVGYVPTGARTKHGRRNLLGYEADVMSARAANVHFDNYFKAIADTLRAIGCPPAGMCMDSHEAGIQNWTEGFERVLGDTLGCDVTPWLATLSGYIVDGRAESEAFLRTFRKAVAAQIAENYYGTFARRCAAEGVDYTSQAMLNILTDNLAGRGRATKPQGEFWTYQTNGNYDVLDAASAAHLYGRPIASGEAFTDTPYSASWPELLRVAALAWCRGINEFAVCASTHQPWPDRKVDDDASAHPYVFHRHHPRWSESRPFWDYQARVASMMRQGRPVVDLCVYIGEEPPVKTMAFRLPVIPEGYKFDVANYDALARRMTPMPDGSIAVEGGMTYRALVVPDCDFLTPDTRKAIERLEQGGAIVVRCDRGQDVARRLEQAGLRPDLTIKSANRPDNRVTFFHRATGSADIYLIYNHSDDPYDGPATPRRAFSRAELWNPADGSRRRCNPSKLHLDPHQAVVLTLF